MYAIIRKQSQKKSDITKVQRHNMRLNVEVNIDSKQTKNNRLLLGSVDLKNDVNDYIKNNNLVVRNKTTIVANEYILTASPEFFFNNSDGSKKSKKDYEENLNKWVENQLDYIKNNSYGVAVNAVLHMDESTPHIHFLSVPVVDQKLNNKALWRGKNSYSKLIDDYTKHVQKQFKSLKRGVSNEEREDKVTHQTIKEYRADVAINKTEVKKLKNESKNLKKTIDEAKKSGFRVGLKEFEDKNIINKINLLNVFKNNDIQKLQKNIVFLENRRNFYKKQVFNYKIENEDLKEDLAKNKKNLDYYKKIDAENKKKQEFDQQVIKHLAQKNEELLLINNNLTVDLEEKNEFIEKIKLFFAEKWSEFLNHFYKKDFNDDHDHSFAKKDKGKKDGWRLM